MQYNPWKNAVLSILIGGSISFVAFLVFGSIRFISSTEKRLTVLEIEMKVVIEELSKIQKKEE